MSGRRWFVLGAATAAIVAAGLFLMALHAPRATLPAVPPASGAVPSPLPDGPGTGLPDHGHTPGSINPAVSQENIATTVCKPGWARTVRPPSAYTSALKIAQLIQYGYQDRDTHHYQEDHLVPLELGGAPRDPANLWPQPNEGTQLPDGTAVGSDEKDDLEDYLNRQVCSGAMLLADAQRLIAGDWIAAWQAAGRP